MPAYVAERGTDTASQTSPVTVAISGTMTAGNLGVLMIVTLNTAVISNIMDSQGNTWSLAKSSSVNTGTYMYYSKLTHNLVGGTDTITITTSSGNIRGWMLEEFSGIATSPLQSTPSTTANNTTAAMNMTAAGATAQDVTLMINFIGGNNTGQTFTKDTNCSLFTSNAIGATKEMFAQYEILSSISTPALTTSKSATGGWDGLLVFFSGLIVDDPITPDGSPAISATSTVAISGSGLVAGKFIPPSSNIGATSSMGGKVTGPKNMDNANVAATSRVLSQFVKPTTSIAATSTLFTPARPVKDWPNGTPADIDGNIPYGHTWRARYRPGIDGWTKNGITGPTLADEVGVPYTTRLDGHTYPDLGTGSAPVTIRIDKTGIYNGATDLSTVLPAANIYLSGDGNWMLRNVEVCGSIVVDGVQQIVQSDYVLSSTPTTISVSGNATKSSYGSITGRGFPTTPSSYPVMVGSTLCNFQYATSTTLVGVTTADSQSHLIFAGQYATYLDPNDSDQGWVGLHLRNVRWYPPVAWEFQRVQSNLHTDLTLARPPIAQLTTATITKGSSPATITVNNTTGSGGNNGPTAFPSSGQILVGQDFVSYTGKTSTSFTGCTWPGGGATSDWIVNGTASSYYVYGVENYNIAVDDNTLFASSGVIEIDAGVEVHYQGKSGSTLLTGCVTASRWGNMVGTYHSGLDVRACLGAAYVESQDAGNGWGCFGLVGGFVDMRDCMNSYSGKSPGAFHLYGSVGSTIAHHYSEFNWYDFCHYINSCAQTTFSDCAIVTHCGAGSTGSPHVDGIQGWNSTQLDGTPLVKDCAFMGALTNSHEFWSTGSSPSSNTSNWPPAEGLFYDNCLLAATIVGASGGKGALIDESINCGAVNSWYDGFLFVALQGPTPEATVTSAVTAGATVSIPVDIESIFTPSSPNTTTLATDLTITRNTSYAQILSSLTLTDGSSFQNHTTCYLVLDDGTKACALRGDYPSTNVINNIRWLNGTPGTYLAANTTVYCARSTGSPPVNGMGQVVSDATGRIQVFAYTGKTGSTLTGVRALEYDIPLGTVITPMDPSHIPPVNMVNGGNKLWDTVNLVWTDMPAGFKGVSGTINAFSTVGGSIIASHTLNATINATSTVSGAAGLPRSLAAAQINATSTTSGQATALHLLRPAQINATSTASDTITALRHLAPATINATSTTAVSRVSAKKAVAGTINATSTVASLFSRQGSPQIAGLVLATSAVSAADFKFRHNIRPDSVISATSSLSGHLGRRYPIIPTATIFARSQASASRLNVKHHLVPAHISAQSLINATHIHLGLPYKLKGTISATATVRSNQRLALKHHLKIGGPIMASSKLFVTVPHRPIFGRGILNGHINATSTVTGNVIKHAQIRGDGTIHAYSSMAMTDHYLGKRFKLQFGPVMATSVMSARITSPRHFAYQNKFGKAYLIGSMTGQVTN